MKNYRTARNHAAIGTIIIPTEEYKELLERSLKAEIDERIAADLKYYRDSYFDLLEKLNAEKNKGEKENA